MIPDIQITEEEYNKLHPDFRGVWETERYDIPGWAEKRDRYIGKRTMVYNLNGATVLLIEGISFKIIDNKSKSQKQ